MMPTLRDLWIAWGHAKERHPQLRWLERWGVSAASLVSGTLTLFVFRRGLDYFPWFIGYLILAWLAAVVFLERRWALEQRGRRLTGLVVDYTLQTILHGLLLFLVPIYYASTTVRSRNVGCVLLLAACAGLTAVDPWYRAATRRFPRLETALFGFGLFASLNTALPLFRMSSALALPVSGGLSLIALAPALSRAPRGLVAKPAVIASAAVILIIFLSIGRAWFPPVPLHLVGAAFARGVERLEPQQPFVQITLADLQDARGVVAWTAVEAPSGLREPIEHVWRKDGRIAARVLLSPIRGGRTGGFRTFSRRLDLGRDPRGRWTVDVLTAHGQLIGRLRMEVE